MEVKVIDFPEILSDNEVLYFGLFQGVLEAVDEFSHLQITKFHTSYNFRISPSLPVYNNMILQELLNFNNLFGIKLDLSKSIKSSGIIAFQLKLA